MRAVDTNVLVRLVARDNAQQVAAAESYVRNGAWVSTVVLAETIWVLGDTYRRSPEELAAIVERLLSAQSIAIQDSEAVAAALVLFRARPSLGFSDCLILELARHAGHLPLGTFDRALGRADGAERLS